MLVISIPGASKLFRILGVIFCTVGIILYVTSGSSFQEFPLLMTSNLPLLTFLALIPFMTSVVHAGRFDRRINQLLNANVKDLGKLYPRSSFITYMLTLFTNLSALTISQNVLRHNLKTIKKRTRNAFMSNATLRAFATAQTWSPIEIAVVITVGATGINIFAFLPWLFLCSIIAILTDWAFGIKKFKSIPYNISDNNKLMKTRQLRKIILDVFKLFSALIIFLMVVVIVGNYFQLSFIFSVILVLIPFTFTWALLIKRLKTFLVVGWRTWKDHTNNMQNFMVLFLSLSLFSNGLNGTTFNEYIQQYFLAFASTPLVILIFIQTLFFLLGLLGINAIVTIGVLVEVLHPLYDVINPISIGIALVTGSLTTAMIGPYGLTVTITSVNTVQNPYRISLRNLPFAIFYCGVALTIAVWLA